jgi:basic amino acid/polyamine antiporter, APA family
MEAATGATPQVTPTFFARRATGLVRESSVWNTAAFNILNVTIAYAILYPALFAWQFPGSSLLLGGVIAVAAFVPLGLIYAMTVAAMPRSGSDYVLVSRVFHPAVGFIVALVFMCWVSFWSGLGINFFFTLGLAPQMATLGLPGVGHFFTEHGWVIGLGIVLLVAMGLLTALSTRQAMRALTALVAVGMFGTLLTAVVLLVTSHGSFVSAFNSFAKPFSHSANTYADVSAAAAKGGFDANHPFSFTATLGLVPWAATSFIYIAGQAALGGEIKRPARNSFIAIYLTIGALLVLLLLVFAGLDSAVGQKFVDSASYVSANAPTHWPLPAAPNYNFLATVATSSTVIRWVLSICFAIWYLPGPILNYIFISRYMVATSLDGVLPERLGRVNPRTHTPLLAIGIGLVLSIGSLILLTLDGNITTILNAVLGELVGGYLLLSVAAIAFPYMRRTRQAYRASPANINVFGIPLISIMGVISTIVLLVIGWVFWTNPKFGLDTTAAKITTFALPAAALVIYWISRQVRLARNQDISLAFKEIPPA